MFVALPCKNKDILSADTLRKFKDTEYYGSGDTEWHYADWMETIVCRDKLPKAFIRLNIMSYKKTN